MKKVFFVAGTFLLAVMGFWACEESNEDNPVQAIEWHKGPEECCAVSIEGVHENGLSGFLVYVPEYEGDNGFKLFVSNTWVNFSKKSLPADDYEKGDTIWVHIYEWSFVPGPIITDHVYVNCKVEPCE